MPALEPVLEQIGSLTERIRDYEMQLETIAKEHYPHETDLLRQVEGSRNAYGAYLRAQLGGSLPLREEPLGGGVPGTRAGHRPLGDSDPQKRISKEGDEMLRRLLVGSAHYILGPFGKDSDLRRHGEKIASRGGKNAKKRAVVAVARKLCVLLHSLWVSGEVYDPLYNANRRKERGEAA